MVQRKEGELISVLTKAEAFEDVDAICAGVLIALNEMREAAGVLGLDSEIPAIETQLFNLHAKAGFAAMEAPH